MPQQPTTIYDPYGRAVGAKGAEAGKEGKYNEIAESEAREAYRKAQGMSGIGKAGARAKPEYKQKEDAHIAAWRKEQEAKRVAQAKAAKDLAEKEKPTKVAAGE